MKALTPSDLNSILDSEMTWRRKEISSLVTLSSKITQVEQNAVIRAAIPLLYAHWEGFGRECVVRYLEFVSYRRMKFKNLQPSFLYLASVASLSGLDERTTRDGIEAVQGIILRTEATNKDSFRKKVSTKSNLRSDILDDLLALCGLPTTDFAAHADFINRELCDPRNEIAHGGGGAPSPEKFIERRDRTFALMSQLQTAVVNAAVSQQYRRN